jgi:DNA (cytosine-5)-methyltransferase 1
MECVAKSVWPNWPTASATDYKGVSKPGQRRGQLGEAIVRENWPTPDASVANDGETLESWEARRERVKATGINGNGMGTPLAMAVKMLNWPTATVSDCKGAGLNPKSASGHMLVAAVLKWPTATAGDAKSSGSAGYSTKSGRSDGTTLTDAAVRGIRAGATESKSIKGMKLNPAWVEQLMGFPPGWTLLDPTSSNTPGKRPASSRKRKTEPRALKPLGTPSSRKSRRSSGDD